MTKDESKRLKIIEEELAYLRKSIDTLIKTKPIEIHSHYYYDYESILGVINHAYKLSEEDDII